MVGSLQERGLLDRVFKNPDALNEDVAVAMQPPLATVDVTDSLDQVFADLSGPNAAVVVAASRPAGRDPHALRPARVPRTSAHRQVRRVLAPPHFSEPDGDEDRAADDQRRADADRGVSCSSRSSAPSAIATSGLTYWCVTTFEIGAFRAATRTP